MRESRMKDAVRKVLGARSRRASCRGRGEGFGFYSERGGKQLEGIDRRSDKV